MTYKEAFDKITEAYIKDEIQPFDPEFCFCGTLSRDRNWAKSLFHLLNPYPYTLNEYGRMEKALFSKLPDTIWYWAGGVSCDTGSSLDIYKFHHSDTYESDLFAGMCAALDVLKQIHIERGEIIDNTPAFIKRHLA